MKKYTPGPWQEVVVFGTIPYVVAPVTKEVVAERVFNGNENLIAAAPDLLAALEAILRSAGYEAGEAEPTLSELRVSRAALDAARAATQKARAA